MISAETAQSAGRPEPATQAEHKVRKKVRIRFRKAGPLRFIGHHDLMRCWDRMFRRAGLPVRFSQGFHPKPRISFPMALGLGLIGQEELVEVELSEDVSTDEIRARIESETVDGLTIRSVVRIPPELATEVVAVEYECPIPDALRSDLASRVDALMAAPAVTVERRHPNKPTRRIDIRPLVLGLALRDDRLWFRIRVTRGGTLRAEEMLRALGIERFLEEGVVVTRTRVESND